MFDKDAKTTFQIKFLQTSKQNWPDIIISDFRDEFCKNIN